MSKYVITLVADPKRQTLPADGVAEVARAMRADWVEWLSPDEACDLYFTLGAAAELQSVNPFYLLRRALGSLVNAYSHTFGDAPLENERQRLRVMIGDAPVDAVIQRVHDRKRRVFVSDMDSTVITVECIDELADFVGRKTEVAAITARAMNGELDFEAALTERVRLLEGLPEALLQQCYDERVRFMPGARELIATLKAKGIYTLLVSGGFSFFTSRVREALGFDADQSNTLEVQGGVLTGRVVPPILGKDAKKAALLEACRRQGVSTVQAVALGDGANDVPMLREAGLGIAYRAKPAVRTQIPAQINHNDLSALLFVMGYRREEWIEFPVSAESSLPSSLPPAG